MADEQSSTQSVEDTDEAKEVITDFLLGIMNNQSLSCSNSGVMVQVKAAELLGSVWNVYHSDYI